MADAQPRAGLMLTRIAGGEMAGRVRAFDWSCTPIGAMETWSPSLRLVVDMILATNFPMAVRWGPALCLIYNDAYAPSLHDLHPSALGMRFDQYPEELQASLRKMHDDILAGDSGGYALEKMPLSLKRDGDATARIGHFNISYSPVPDTSAPTGVGGVLITAVELTEAVETERTLHAAKVDLDLAVSAAHLGRWDHNPHVGARFWDARARAIFGLSDTVESTTENFEQLVHPEDLAGVRAAVAVALDPRGVGRINHEYRIRRASDGAQRWVETFGRAYFEGEHCTRFVGVVSDVTERKETEAHLLRQEETLRLAIDAADLGIFELDVATGLLTWSDRCFAMFGVPPGEPVTLESFYERLHPEDLDATRLAMAQALDPEVRAAYAIEFRAIGRDDGQERWIAAKGQGLFSPEGKATRLLGATVNITDRKRAEMHLRLLVNELNHRVKNSLATIQAIAAQSFNAARPLAEAQEAFTNRIVALAEAHDLLTRENWEGAELHDIAARLALLHGGATRFELTGPAIRLSPRTALSLSMVLHELATNAVKYGALSVPGGRVLIRWGLAPGTGAERLDLIWTETGGPPVSPPTQRGFGSRLIERGLAAELSGEASIRFEPAGVVCHIRALLEA